MTIIITEPKDLIAKYVALKCDITSSWGDYSGVALVDGEGVIRAGAVFYGYKWPNIMVNIAAEKMSSSFIAAITHYPFEQLQCRCVTGVILGRNTASRKFAEHWGAVCRGKLEAAAPDDDLMIYQLMADRARKWLSEPYMRKLAVEVA